MRTFLRTWLRQPSSMVYVLLFCAVMGLAFYSRFSNLYARTQWFDDSARDMLIAKKIYESGTVGTVRPFAGAGQGVLNNSIIYYNILALFWMVGKSSLSVMYSFTFFGVLALLAGWEIGRQVGGKWLGLACLALLAINTTLAQYQLSVYQRNFLPSFALIIVAVSLWVWKCPSLRRLIFLHFVFTFGVLLHYGLLTLAPGVLLMTFLVWRRNIHPPLEKAAALLISFLGCSVFWMVTTFSSPLRFLLFSQQTTLENVPAQGAWATWELHVAAIYDFLQRVYSFTSFSELLPVVWMLFWLLGFWLFFQPKISAAFRIYFFYLSTYFLNHLVFLQAGQIHFTGSAYTTQYQALALLLIPIVVFIFLQHAGCSGKKILSVLAVTAITFFALEWRSLQALPIAEKYSNEVTAAKKITEQIMADYAQLRTERPHYQNFVLTDYTSWATPGWFTPAFLSFVEEEEGRSYAKLKSDHNNLAYTFSTPADVIYLVCHQWKNQNGLYDISEEIAQQECLEPFILFYLLNYTQADYQKVERSLLIGSNDNPMGVNVYRITRPTSEGEFMY